MTHAIYIAVVLVLFVYAYWRDGQLQDARDDLRTERRFRIAAESTRDAQREHARRWKAAAHSNEQYYRIAADIGNETQDLLDQCQASNRSLRGWNGRYRRRIAELEEEVSGLVDEVGCLEAELADEKG